MEGKHRAEDTPTGQSTAEQRNSTVRDESSQGHRVGDPSRYERLGGDQSKGWDSQR
jgi:hypothetical protein